MIHPDQIALKAHHSDLARDFQPKRRPYGQARPGFSASGFRGTAISAIVVVATMSFVALQFGFFG